MIRLSYISVFVAKCLLVSSQVDYDGETYQFPSGHDPYRYFLNFVDDPFVAKNIHVRQDIAPIEGHIIFPNASGRYPWIDVQHGFLGEFPEFVYGEWLQTLVSLGFIVTYGMPNGNNHHEFNPADNFTAWNTWNTWVRENGNELIQEESAMVGKDVELDVEKLGMVCHADGCDMTKQFMIEHADMAAGYFFLDPVYSVNNVDTAVTLSGDQTVVVAQTDMCARCCEASENYDTRTFDSISGQNIKTFQLLKEVGHCSAWNFWFMDNCRKGRYCEMPRMQMNEARNFHRHLSGWVTSQMTYSMFGRADMKRYFTEANRFPSNFITNNDIQCDSDAPIDKC